MGKILILEDDQGMTDWLRDTIARDLADLDPDIEAVETEAEFVLHWLVSFDEGKVKKPEVFVIDIMLRWTDPDPDQPARPPEVIKGGFMRAGLRCVEAIRERKLLSRIPIILFTSLTKDNMDAIGGKPANVEFVNKDDSQVVLRKIRDALLRSSGRR